MLLNSDTLRTLLGSNRAQKKRDLLAANDLIRTILLEEIADDRSANTNRYQQEKAPKKKKRAKRPRALEKEYSSSSRVDRARIHLLLSNNIFDYGGALDVPRDAIDLFERHVHLVRSQINSQLEYIISVVQKESGDALSPGDVSLILERTGLCSNFTIDEFFNAPKNEHLQWEERTVSFGFFLAHARTALRVKELVRLLGEKYNCLPPSGGFDESYNERNFRDLTQISSSKASQTWHGERPHSYPDQSLNDLASPGNAASFFSNTRSALPPLKVTCSRKELNPSENRQKKHFESLRNSISVPSSSGNFNEINSTSDISWLRRELQISKNDVKRLNELVDHNIAWVQSNCDLSSLSSRLSSRVKRKCQLMAAERISRVYQKDLSRTLSWALHRWREVLQYSALFRQTVSYCKIKSIQLLTISLVNCYLRRVSRKWQQWVQHNLVQMRLEKDAAAVVIQSSMRRHLSKIQVAKLRLGKTAIVIQSLFRRIKAVEEVRGKATEKLNIHAAMAIQKLFKRLIEIRKAKLELQRRKADKAVIKIQKVFRGVRDRERLSTSQMEGQKQNLEQSIRNENNANKEVHDKTELRTDIDALAASLLTTAPEIEKHEDSHVTQTQANSDISEVGGQLVVERHTAPKVVPATISTSQSISVGGNSAKPSKHLASTLVPSRAKINREKRNSTADQMKDKNNAPQKRNMSRSKKEIKSTITSANILEKRDRKNEFPDRALDEYSRSKVETADIEIQTESDFFPELPITQPAPLNQPPDNTSTISTSAQELPTTHDSSRNTCEEGKDNKDEVCESPVVPVVEPAQSDVQSDIKQATPVEVHNDAAKLIQKITRKKLSKHVAEDKRIKSASVKAETTKSTKPIRNKSASKPTANDVSSSRKDHTVHSSFEDFQSEMRTYSNNHERRIEVSEPPPESSWSSTVESDQRQDQTMVLPKKEKELANSIPDSLLLPGSLTILDEANGNHPQDENLKTLDGHNNARSVQIAQRADHSSHDIDINGHHHQVPRPFSAAQEQDLKTSISEQKSPNMWNNNSELVQSVDGNVSRPMETNPLISRPASSSHSANREAIFDQNEESKIADGSRDDMRVILDGDEFPGDVILGETGGVSNNQAFDEKVGNNSPEKKDDEIMHINEAASKIQRCVRANLARRAVERKREQIKAIQAETAKIILWAIITFQRISRGKLGRKRVLELLLLRKISSATKIQTLLRGKAARERVRALKTKQQAQRKQQEWLESYLEINAPIPASYSDPDPVPEPSIVVPESPVSSKHSSPVRAATPVADSTMINDEKLKELDEKLKMLEEIERRIKESEDKVRQEAKKAEERMAEQLRLFEEKSMQAEAERLARNELMQLAVGPVTNRSPFSTLPNKNSGSIPPTSRLHKSPFSTVSNVPPTGRSAREGPIPSSAPRLLFGGQEWVQLWDQEHQAFYWWCEKTQHAQWEQPGMDILPTQHASEEHDKDDALSDSGYESTGAMTDYSSDHDTSYFKAEAGDLDGWQEYWDEQAQAKYWYNNNTGEASWTLPDELQSRASLITAQSSIESGYGNGWTSYIDEQTGQMYWHNINTGEVRWDY